LAAHWGAIAAITSAPKGLWMEQIARNLVDCEDGCLVDCRYL